MLEPLVPSPSSPMSLQPPPPAAARDPVTPEGRMGPMTPEHRASGPPSQAQPLLRQEAKEEEEEGEETGVQGAWGTGTAEQRRRGWGEAAEAAAAEEGQAEAEGAAAAGSGSQAGGAGGGRGGWRRLLAWLRRRQPQCCPCAAPLPRSAAHGCHGGTKMAALAYNLGKREINHYFSVRSAKVLALVAVLLLAACHLASRRYRDFEKMGNTLQKEAKYEAKPEMSNDGRQVVEDRVALKDSVAKPHVIVAGAATWSIKIHNGSNEALSQYKMNITSIAPLLEKLAKTSDVYWVLQDPVYEDLLSENRKMITNEKIDAYNEAAVSILNSSTRNSKSNVKMFSVSKLIAQETIMESLDGLHLPESSRETSAMILMNVYCNKILKPVDGSCCQPQPPLTLIQKLAACFFTLSIIGYLIFYIIHRHAHRKNKPCTDLESGEEKKNIINNSASPLEILLQSFCKLGLIMAYFYMCDRANLFMKENKFYTHSSFFIPIIYILVLGVFYNENTKEFLPVYMHIRVLVAAYLFQTGYGHFSYFWIKGDFGIHRVCQTYSIWASSCKNKAECNELHPSVSVVQILAFILIRNIPGYARSVYSSFFAWFGKISLELFICQYHIWLAADTRGILVLIPGNPMLNIIVSTFIFVCVAHEISQITNDLAHIIIPKDNSSLLKRLACIAAFFCGLLILSSIQDKSRH
ncbi:CAS1 domain-containing protein 1 [Sciurus carolinensis]|uniref:CAS1 domain-containing protein 1 n=1 Tax=Sciurus carolinensis TaxID=30640 RepID=A0AA41MGA6_SCICA|nr:CAS1 domain-containing protein 1 [Sciurus carolinensis]